MSWRGEEGGIAAAKQHHKVVMTPGAYCYFDHYQASPLTQPLAIGGYLTVQKVYSFHPIPDSLKGEERKFILGAQGNLWTEYIPTFDQLTFMALPRMSALAGEEVSNNAIEVYIHRLRKKIEQGPVRIATVRGLGYCLEKIAA